MRNKGNHEPKSWPGIFVGYQDLQPIGLRIYLQVAKEFIIAAHAEFEDHQVRKLGSEDNNRLFSASRYTTAETDSVGKKPDSSDGNKSSLQDAEYKVMPLILRLIRLTAMMFEVLQTHGKHTLANVRRVI